MQLNENQLANESGVGFIHPPQDIESARAHQANQVQAAAELAEQKASKLLGEAHNELAEARRQFAYIVRDIRELCGSLESSQRQIYEALAATRDLPAVTDGIQDGSDFRESLFHSRKLGEDAWRQATAGLNLSAFPEDVLQTRLGAELASAMREMVSEQSGLRIFEPGTAQYIK